MALPAAADQRRIGWIIRAMIGGQVSGCHSDGHQIDVQLTVAHDTTTAPDRALALGQQPPHGNGGARHGR
jgi:hypothetical protein